MWRSLMYVPGDRPERVAKALAIAAAGGDEAPDALIIDLEDAVAPNRKHIARDAAGELLAARRPTATAIVVRVNSGARGADDLAALAPGRPDAFIIPKAEAGAAIHADGIPLIPLIETARGMRDIHVVAARPAVLNLAIGEADLGSELGIARGADHAWWPLRMQVVVASAAAGLQPPTAPVWVDAHDRDGLRASSAALKAAGFGARAAIHPGQVATINEVFRPSAEEVEAAQRLVAEYDAALAAGVGVFTDADGRMVDEAVVRAARHLLPPPRL